MSLTTNPTGSYSLYEIDGLMYALPTSIVVQAQTSDAWCQKGVRDGPFIPKAEIRGWRAYGRDAIPEVDLCSLGIRGSYYFVPMIPHVVVKTELPSIPFVGFMFMYVRGEHFFAATEIRDVCGVDTTRIPVTGVSFMPHRDGQKRSYHVVHFVDHRALIARVHEALKQRVQGTSRLAA